MPHDIDTQSLEREGRAAYIARRFQDARTIAHTLYNNTGDPRYALLEADAANYMHRAPEAVRIIESLIERRGGDSTKLVLLAYYLRAAGRFEESREALTGVSPDTPGYAAIYGWHLLREGNFTEGMREIEKESGIYREESRREYPTEKKLRPGEEIDGLTILLILEGGFGDQILQSRYTQSLRIRGAKIILECSARLVSMLLRTEGISGVYAHGTVSSIAYDRYIAGQSVVGILSLDRPPEDAPLLSPLPDLVNESRPQIDAFARGRKKIGIHWQGNWEFDWSEMKSPKAESMLRFKINGALFSLQRDAGANDIPAGCDVYNAESGEASWEHTMAVLAQMDIVVSNCTSTAHLTAAMGRPTILLAAHAPHYYWASAARESVDTTPWYRTLRVARQPHYDDWEGAITHAQLLIDSL